MNEDKLKYFVKMNQEIKHELRRLEKRSRDISAFRGLAFVLSLACTAFAVSDKLYFLIAPGILFFAVFIWLVKVHADCFEAIELNESREQVTERYILRFRDKWREFSDSGEEFLTSGDTVAQDIDLLGRGSLYQMINVCHTARGRKLLADRLKAPYVGEAELEQRTKAIAELSDKREFAVEFEAAGERLAKKKAKVNEDEFEKRLKSGDGAKLPAWAQAARFLLPLCFLTSVVLSICGVVSYAAILVVFFVLLSFSWLTAGVSDDILAPVRSISSGAQSYLAMLSWLEEQDFESALMRAYKERVIEPGGISEGFKRLSAIAQAFNVSFNPVVHQLLSGTVLWDYQLATAASKWRETYGEKCGGIFDLIAETEELLSFAVVSMVRDTGIFEMKKDSDIAFCCEEMVHPLIAPEQAVANSVGLSGGITIITGSNMSGKTTFLRTVAVNLVLAYLGAPVTAKRITASRMKIFTSMRIRDDVLHGISTFYAEILRIKQMAEAKKEGIPMLCLIDEIFKGTNSADRIVGAQSAIRKLAGKDCITVVSTHDFELCTLTAADGTPAVNKHFEEHYENDELKFDYKIKEGRCTTTNARAILKMAGLAD
ncbi:MAG: DNA mismatch repair protein MutS [Lachnospiraceae bacterium]|nr:DNA mismatch repair protein MutS [Lachnospiraceae bacterium]